MSLAGESNMTRFSSGKSLELFLRVNNLYAAVLLAHFTDSINVITVRWIISFTKNICSLDLIVERVVGSTFHLGMGIRYTFHLWGQLDLIVAFHVNIYVSTLWTNNLKNITEKTWNWPFTLYWLWEMNGLHTLIQIWQTVRFGQAWYPFIHRRDG